jgi:serine/threonine protein phosphatase 1
VSFHLQFDPNPLGRDFVVGDLHGMTELLEQELAAARFDGGRDRLFSVGDLVDRGKDSLQAARLLDESWFWAVRGNHEEMLLDVVDHGGSQRVRLWRLNGGDWGLRWGRPTAAAREAAQLCRGLPHVITLTHRSGWRVGICHAQCPVDDWDRIDETERDERLRGSMLWGRDRICADRPTRVANVDLSVHGHTITPDPLQVENRLYIDTGAYASGRLTLLCLDDWIAERQNSPAETG